MKTTVEEYIRKQIIPATQALKLDDTLKKERKSIWPLSKLSTDIDLKDETDRINDTLNTLWKRVNSEKEKLDQGILVTIQRWKKENIYHDEITAHKAEVDQTLSETFSLQEKLAEIEKETLTIAGYINHLLTEVLKKGKGKPAKILGEQLDKYFIDLRRQINRIISLISRVYEKDPDEFCPSCH